MNIINHNESSFTNFREEEFFKRIKDRAQHTDTIVDVMSFGLISRDGETSFSDFRARIESYWPYYMKAWNESCKSRSFDNLPKAVRLFLNCIKADDIVDEKYPLFRTIGYPKNSFVDVRLLKSLSIICGCEAMAPDFLFLLAQTAPDDPLNYLNYIALAQLLQEKKEFRKAADFALMANGLRANDLCGNKTVVSTQKSLIGNKLNSDFDRLYYDYRDRFCGMPFTSLTVSESSRLNNQSWAFSLCEAGICWTQQIFEKDFSWNNSEAQEFRRSILDGSFRYCDELKCQLLYRNSLPRRADVSDPYMRKIIDNSTVILEKGPEKIGLNYDRSCSLSCPSCRDKVYVADRDTTEFYNKTMDAMLPQLLANAKKFSLSSTGEALTSKHFRHLLKSITPSKYPDLSILLKTNLKLVSERTWNDLGETADLIKTLHLSIDGATPQTLEKMRRGLKWDRMLDALNFVRDLRRNSKIEHVIVIFVIQKENFRELPLMIEMCSRYCIDVFNAIRITAHGSYTNDQMRDIDVGAPSNLLHAEYIDVIKRTESLHKEMQKNTSEILALGRSVPIFKQPAI